MSTQRDFAGDPTLAEKLANAWFFERVRQFRIPSSLDTLELRNRAIRVAAMHAALLHDRDPTATPARLRELLDAELDAMRRRAA